MELNDKEIVDVLRSHEDSKKIDLLKNLRYEEFKRLSKSNKDFVKYVFSCVKNKGLCCLIYNFSKEDVWDLYDKFREEIEAADDDVFIETVEYVGYYCGDKTTSSVGGNVICDVKAQREAHIAFLENIFVTYEKRLANMTSYSMLLHFLVNMLDKGINCDLLDKFIFNNKEKLNEAFKMCDCSRLFDLFEGFETSKQIYLLSHFFDVVYNHDGFKGLCNCLHDDTLVYIYKKDINAVSKIGLQHFLTGTIDDEKKEIIDKYGIEDFGILFSHNVWCRTKNVKYVEPIFMNKISCDGNIEKIDENTTVFSEVYLKNLKEIRSMIESRRITRNSEIYREHFKVFYKYLVGSINLLGLDEEAVREIEKFFFRILRKDGLWIIRDINSLSMIALFNRVGIVASWANQFSVEQILNYNVKEYKKLCEIIKVNNKENIGDYEQYVLKLMLLVGYKRAEYILNFDSDIDTLHHLVGSVGVKNIKMDDNGNPIVDNKFINLLFKDKDHNRVKLMLENKDCDLYKYFPRIVNEWEMIKLSNKNKSLKEVIEFLKNGGVVVPDKYYRLDGSFELIGRSNELILEAFALHDEMLKRVESTIPRIKGKVNDYEYEVLRYDDMEGLTVGNATDCCFTVKGASQTSLRHALTSKNGRILTVKKNGELLAHSWLWRNGNTLCLDNIEISKKIKQVDFLEVYEEFASKIVEESLACEGNGKGIVNVLIGGDIIGNKYKGIDKYTCYVNKDIDNFKKVYKEKMIAPIEEGLYSDAKSCQWLIKGNGDFSLYQSDYYYKDERKDVLKYDESKKDDWNFIRILNKRVNALRILKEGKEDVDKIDVRGFSNVYSGEDFYILVDKKGNVESFINSNDIRAKEEMNVILMNIKKR